MRERKYISVNWILLLQSIFNSTYIRVFELCHSSFRYSKFVIIERTRFTHDIPPFDPFRFWKRNSRGEDSIAKAIRIKRKGEEKERRRRRKKGKVTERERERERKGGNDCFTMTDTCSPSSTNYELFEFVRVLRVSSIFLARTRPIRTRVFNPRLNYAHVRPSARNEDK